MLFKIGDRVQYVGSGIFGAVGYELYNGDTLEVTEIWEDYSFPFGSTDRAGKIWFLCEEELRLADDS